MSARSAAADDLHTVDRTLVCLPRSVTAELAFRSPLFPMAPPGFPHGPRSRCARLLPGQRAVSVPSGTTNAASSKQHQARLQWLAPAGSEERTPPPPRARLTAPVEPVIEVGRHVLHPRANHGTSPRLGPSERGLKIAHQRFHDPGHLLRSNPHVAPRSTLLPSARTHGCSTANPWSGSVPNCLMRAMFSRRHGWSGARRARHGRSEQAG
jgi:hypothetical protein